MSKLFVRFLLAMLLGFSFFAVVSVAPLSAGVLLPEVVTINEFPVPTAGSEPNCITEGPDGNLWFTEYGGNNIGRITTAGVITEFPVPIPFNWYITEGPDGNLWFAEAGGNKIGRITTAGVITEFPLPTANSAPSGITEGPDGNLWFTEWGGNKIGQITTAGAITEFPLPTGGGPGGITEGPDGNLWFTVTGVSANKIGRITTAGAITEFPVPTAGSEVNGITEGPDGNLWFTETAGNKIGRITTAGAITEFPVPTAGSEPNGITEGPDGNLWFAEAGGNNIGRITTAGVITEFPVPTAGSGPTGITEGPDGNLWFTEWGGNKIGQVIITVAPSTCTSFTYSAWSACVNGEETRTVISSSPAGCTGGNPVLTQSCTSPTCTYTCTAWGPCSNGTQTCTTYTTSPTGCTGGTVPTQPCTLGYCWNTTFSTRASISGIGSTSGVGYGNLTLSNNGTFNLYDATDDLTFTGTYVYTTGEKKDTVHFTLDQNGVNQLIALLTEWAQNWAARKGATVSNLNFQFNPPTNLTVTISHSTNLPSSLNVSIRGTVSAILNGKSQNKSFSYTSKITFQPCTTPPTTCTSFTYSAWSACVNGEETRTVISSSPAGCTGGNPVLTQSCTPPPTCTSFTYSAWSSCVNGQETRTVISSSPAGCTGGNPVLTQSCTPPTCTYTCTAWGSCQSNDTQTCTNWTASPTGCNTGTVPTQPCTYVPPPTTCTSFTYSAWSACVNGEETRTVISSSPTGCTGGNPVTSQLCMTCDQGWGTVNIQRATWVFPMDITIPEHYTDVSCTLTLSPWGVSYNNGNLTNDSGSLRIRIWAVPFNVTSANAQTFTSSATVIAEIDPVFPNRPCNSTCGACNSNQLCNHETQTGLTSTATETDPPQGNKPEAFCIVMTLEEYYNSLTGWVQDDWLQWGNSYQLQ